MTNLRLVSKPRVGQLLQPDDTRQRKIIAHCPLDESQSGSLQLLGRPNRRAAGSSLVKDNAAEVEIKG